MFTVKAALAHREVEIKRERITDSVATGYVGEQISARRSSPYVRPLRVLVALHRSLGVGVPHGLLAALRRRGLP